MIDTRKIDMLNMAHQKLLRITYLDKDGEPSGFKRPTVAVRVAVGDQMIDLYDLEKVNTFLRMITQVYFKGKEERSREIMELLRVDK